MTKNHKSLAWSRGKLEYVPRCPSCQSNQRSQRVYERRDNDLFMPDVWRIVECHECQTLWLEARPDDASLPKAYDNYYTHKADQENIDEHKSNSLVWKLIYGYLNHRFGMKYKSAYSLGYLLFSLIEPWRLKLDYYGRHLTYKNVGQPGKLLDIGCGNGNFIQRANDMGWQAQGCEIDPKAVKTCHELGLDVLQGDAFHSELKPNSFDVITLSHVIEHVADQKGLLSRIYELLKPNGVLWLAAPNPQSLGLKISKSAWHALHPPFHLIMPSHKILQTYLTNIGFIDIKALRRGAHVNQIWNISRQIAENEKIDHPSEMRLKILKNIADLISTFRSRSSEEIIFLSRKPRD